MKISNGGKEVQKSRPLQKLFLLGEDQRERKKLTPCTLDYQDDEEEQEAGQQERDGHFRKSDNDKRKGEHAVKGDLISFLHFRNRNMNDGPQGNISKDDIADESNHSLKDNSSQFDAILKKMLTKAKES